MDSTELVTVFTTNNAPEAEMIKNLLEAEKIPCEIANETQAGLSGILKIPVFVRAADEKRAIELISSHGKRGALPEDERP